MCFFFLIRKYLINNFVFYVQVHELPPDKLKIREIVPIDIANDPVSSGDYKEDEDPSIFKSKKTGRGPLTGPNWRNEVQPVMTCYKLVTCEFKWFGLQVCIILPFFLIRFYFDTFPSILPIDAI